MCVTVDGFVVGKIIQATNINFPVAKYSQAMANVAESTITAESFVSAWIVPNTEWDADDLVGYSVIATPQAGSIDFYIFCNGPIVGDFKLNYFWS